MVAGMPASPRTPKSPAQLLKRRSRQRARAVGIVLLLALVPVVVWTRGPISRPLVQPQAELREPSAAAAAHDLQALRRQQQQTLLGVSSGVQAAATSGSTGAAGAADQHGSSNREGSTTSNGGGSTGGGYSGDTYGPNERSYYLKWIQQDLAYWRESGISAEMVNNAHWRTTECNKCNWDWCKEQYTPSWLRFWVLEGRLYVEHEQPPPKGHYPAEYGRGWLSAKGRIPYAIMALVDVLHHFPGQIPDLEGVLGTVDQPCIPKTRVPKPGGGDMPAPPMFSYDGHPRYTDLPFPDYSFWGHEVGMLDDDKGKWVFGWDDQMSHYACKWAQPLAERVPRMVWRGRTDHFSRDELRRNFTECPLLFTAANDSTSAGLFNLWDDENIGLDSMCRYRYQVYLQSQAWSTNFKQKLACGSVVLVPSDEYYEFWTRALEPGRHFLSTGSISGMDLCEAVVKQVNSMNAFVEGAQRARAKREALGLSGGQPGQAASAAGAAGSDAVPGVGAGRRRLRQQGGSSGSDSSSSDGGSSRGAGLPLGPWQEAVSAEPQREGLYRRGHARALGRPGQQQQAQLQAGEWAAEAVEPAEGQQQQQQQGPGAPQGPGVPQEWQRAGQQGEQQGLNVPGTRRRLQQAGSNSGGGGSTASSGGSTASSSGGSGKKYPWGSDYTPQEIADEGRKFLREHVRMRDVRLYLRDLLKEYGALITYKPTLREYSVCVTGEYLLRMFGTPHMEDGFDVQRRYPWLYDFDPGCPKP